MRLFDPLFRDDGAGTGALGAFFVREAHADFRAQLMASLSLNDQAKLLVAGQPGCGKTTLLLTVLDDLRADGRVAAFVDLESDTSVQDLALTEIHIAACVELIRQISARGLPIHDPTLQRGIDWLALVGSQSAQPTPSGVADAFASILRAARDNAALRRVVRESSGQEGVPDPGLMLQGLLGDLSSHEPSHRPVVIFDGLDKLPPARAREVFLGAKIKPMASMPGTTILTIPLSMVYEPDYAILTEQYHNADSAVLPAVRAFELDEQRNVRESREGRGVLGKIVRTRVSSIDAALVDEDAIDRAIESTCGNIRELARLIQASIVKATVQQASQIKRHHVEAAIEDQRETFRRAYQPKFLPVLQRIRDVHELDNVDDVARMLLYGLWAMELRNGQAWYLLPGPVQMLLRQLERSARAGDLAKS